MKIDYSTEFKLFIVQEALKTKNIKRFLKRQEIPKSTFYTWIKKHKNTGIVDNFSTRPKTSPNIFNNQKSINLIIKLYTKEYRGKHYIKAYLNRESIRIGVTAIENVLKRNNLWRYKTKKKKKRYDKRKFVSKIQKEGKIVQIDTKYIKLGRKTVYQFTAVDLLLEWALDIYMMKKTPYNTIDFVKLMLNYSPFRIHCIQSDNCTEFTYRKHSFDTKNSLYIFCKKNYIKRVYSSIASPCYNGVVESTQRQDQKEFYDFCTQELILKNANQKLRKYNNFFNYKLIHSALNYDTPMLYFYKLRNS